MGHAELVLGTPYDLARTLGPLGRGPHDPTIRLSRDTAWLALRIAGRTVSVRIQRRADRVAADAWGPGAEDVAAWLPRLLGIGPGSTSSGDLADAPHAVIRDLARRLPGIHIPATHAMLDALVPAILEQKVTGTEARRAWFGLIRAHGEPAPGVPGSTGSAAAAAFSAPVLRLMPPPELRLTPPPATLARLPYYAYHPFGVEQRRADLIRGVAARAERFEALADAPLPEAYAALRRVPGIGPWTAAEVAVRALGDIDAVSVGDFHLPNLVAWALAGEPRGDDDRMVELLAPYAGRRALVIRLLESSGLRAPRYGPRLAPRRIDAI
jgi:3-methyladenine DNA glycosylase/8-oxoguanine DNA glycosylase